MSVRRSLGAARPVSPLMTSPKQHAANVRNARRSTGPTSVPGKAASRMNALKSGLYAKSLVIRGESKEEFDELAAQFENQFRPVTPQARILVDNVIRYSWLLRRYDRIEGEMWATHLKSVDELLFSSKSQPMARAVSVQEQGH